MLYEWLKDKTAEEAIAALEKFKVPCSPSPPSNRQRPQILHWEMIIEVEQPLSGKVKVGGSPYKMSKTPGNRKLRIPLLGQHNEEIYGGLLGIDKNEIERLKAEGVI